MSGDADGRAVWGAAPDGEPAPGRAGPAAAGREIRPARGDLDVTIRVPGSKSITNRALLLAALANGTSTLHGALDADDTTAFAGGVRALGVPVDHAGPDAWRVQGRGAPFPLDRADVYCADAGTAARFPAGGLRAGEGEYRFDASTQLRRRPLAQLLDVLRAQGARTDPAEAERLPFTLLAGGLRGGSVRLPGDTSSQFVSALLMAAPLAREPLEITVDGLVSRPYVDMTLRMMADFGADAERDGHRGFRVTRGAYRARDYHVEPDASTASYFLAAAAITGGRVCVAGLRRRDSLQGDVRFLDVLEAMGCEIGESEQGLAVGSSAAHSCAAGPAVLRGLTVDMSDISDTFMTLAAIAPFAAAPVTVTGHRERPRQGVRPHRRHGGEPAAARRAHGVRAGPSARVPRRASRRPGRPPRRPPHRHGLRGARPVHAGSRDRRPGMRAQDMSAVLRPLGTAGTGNRLNGASRGHRESHSRHPAGRATMDEDNRGTPEGQSGPRQENAEPDEDLTVSLPPEDATEVMPGDTAGPTRVCRRAASPRRRRPAARRPRW